MTLTITRMRTSLKTPHWQLKQNHVTMYLNYKLTVLRFIRMFHILKIHTDRWTRNYSPQTIIFLLMLLKYLISFCSFTWLVLVRYETWRWREGTWWRVPRKVPCVSSPYYWLDAQPLTCTTASSTSAMRSTTSVLYSSQILV